jgi:hypothetical protein
MSLFASSQCANFIISGHGALKVGDSKAEHVATALDGFAGLNGPVSLNGHASLGGVSCELKLFLQAWMLLPCINFVSLFGGGGLYRHQQQSSRCH